MSTDKADLQQRLSPEQWHVTQEQGTEHPFTGKYCNHKAAGIYVCVCCGAGLFKSETKYDSRSGWPSFWDQVDRKAVTRHEDGSLGMSRTEIVCGECGAHLGHVFPDGPKPTGLRYCVNSLSLDFRDEDRTKDA